MKVPTSLQTGARSLILLMSLSAFAFVACTQKETHRRRPAPAATGRGNGGNTKVSANLVRSSVDNLKAPLRKSFEGLRALALAEQILEGSTTINGDKELLDLILLLTKDSELDLEDGIIDESVVDEASSVFDDIDTKDNFELNADGCFDYRDVENSAGTELLGVGKPICFSLPRLTEKTIEGGETAFQIALIGLAAHEFVHHFVDAEDHEKTEAIANKLQDFLVKDLSRASVLASDEIISIDEFDYVDRFVKAAKENLEQVKIIPPPIEVEEELVPTEDSAK